MFTSTFMLFAAVTLSTFTVGRSVSVLSGSSEAYAAFRMMYRNEADDDSIDYETRHSLFKQRVAEVQAHNAGGHSWRLAVNKFADFTDAERQRLLGYKRKGFAPQQSSFLEVDSTSVHVDDLQPSDETVAETASWTHLASAKYFTDQGSCGSCWAVAAQGALEMHTELATGSTPKLSHQELVDCTPNPRHCGGTGGCDGATAELAFQYVKEHGISLLEGSNAYTNDACEEAKSKTTAVKIGDFVQLPTNKAEPLMKAAMQGPVVVSVDASPWFMYGGGIFGGCKKDAIINHAVLLLGYGEKEGKGFWHIRNSWGADWGDADEPGTIKLRRENDDEYCGIDTKPQDGVACDGDPDTQKVCGMCGVLTDSAYPTHVTMHGAESVLLEKEAFEIGATSIKRSIRNHERK